MMTKVFVIIDVIEGRVDFMSTQKERLDNYIDMKVKLFKVDGKRYIVRTVAIGYQAVEIEEEVEEDTFFYPREG